MDAEFSSSMLDTPSLMTPNIILNPMNPMMYKISHDASSAEISNNDNNDASANPPSITTTTATIINDESSSATSNEIKLSKIKDDLKQSFTQPRKPTESFFQQMAKAGRLRVESMVVSPTQDDSTPIEIPSTADVMNVLESFTKYPTQDTIDREATTTLTSDNNHLETSASHNMGMIVSPKKKLLIRSQSHTEPSSPSSVSTNQFSQSQRNNFDDTGSLDDEHRSFNNSDFQRTNDVPIVVRAMDSSSQLDNNIKLSYTIQLPLDQNGVHSTIIKQQPIVSNNKRTFQQAIIGGPTPKATSIVISQQPVVNEVSSSNQLVSGKRQKTISTNNKSSSPSFSPPINDNNNIGSDDDRRKHIRDSNREAARRCRERRRNYIEQLEGNLEQCKSEIKQLNEKLSLAERENTQLRAILTETKRFHTVSDLSSNDSMVNFVNVISTNGVDLNVESTDGNKNMKFIFFIVFIPAILSTPLHDIRIEEDDDCWSHEKNTTIHRRHAILVKFSSKVAYGKDDCSVHIYNPWLSDMQNGFGLFLSQEMDCSSTLTVDCLPNATLTDQTKPSPIQFTCHTSQNKIEMACSALSLTFRRNIQIPEIKKTTFVQVVALAKEPCIDDDILFQCPDDYPNSCIDKKLKCNGRSECDSGDDERDCHPAPPSGVPIFILVLMLLVFLFLLCILSIACICCCFRSVFNGIVRRVRARKGNKSTEKNNIATTGEDAVLMKELTTPTTTVEISSKNRTEAGPLIIDSTKPMYPTKVTYFNLENTYGPYCNPKSKFTPDAGIVRYAGTPWIGKCVLNIQSCCLPTFPNGSLMPDLPLSTRFYVHLLAQPLCSTENVTVTSESGETTLIDCHTKNGTEYFFDTELLTIEYHRSKKLPLSKFSMVVTPLKIKTRMYSKCGFDCFSDKYCIDRSLVCDRYKNCPNNVDEAYCEYSHHHEPLSFRAKLILSFVLLTIITLTVSSILICYFCCGITDNNLGTTSKERKSLHGDREETDVAVSPLSIP
ncbi:unnamed protein product [Rotaria socialis]|uniref:BZIP domain-containing protein n=1 Tax=Rotaria socialis TaxID=392032 RepID=A0A817SV85_9BILA|nr:unnamed protein product [Rotaria socialis]